MQLCLVYIFSFRHLTELSDVHYAICVKKNVHVYFSICKLKLWASLSFLFSSEKVHFLVVEFSVYLNRHVFVMKSRNESKHSISYKTACAPNEDSD